MKKLSDFFKKVINTHKCPLKDSNPSHKRPLVHRNIPYLSAKKILASYICPLNIHFFTQKCPYLVFCHPIFVRFFQGYPTFVRQKRLFDPTNVLFLFFIILYLSVSSRGILHLSVSSKITIQYLSVKKVLFPNLRHNI